MSGIVHYASYSDLLDHYYANVHGYKVNDSSVLLLDLSVSNKSSGLFYFDSFLNTTRAGSAHKHAGISFETFLSSVFISIVYCILQVTMFSLLRTKIRHIYRGDDGAANDEGIFGWIKPTVLNPLQDYKSIGLDAYFFVRYLKVLLVLFAGLAMLNLPILIPINFCSGTKLEDILEFVGVNGSVSKAVQESISVRGLDRVSMSNISIKHADRLWVHLGLAIVAVIWFHIVLVCELRNYVKIKNAHILNEKEEGLYANTLFIDNLPLSYSTKHELISLFNRIYPNSIKNMWFVPDYTRAAKYFYKHQKLTNKIESHETFLIYQSFFATKFDQVIGTDALGKSEINRDAIKRHQHLAFKRNSMLHTFRNALMLSWWRFEFTTCEVSISLFGKDFRLRMFKILHCQNPRYLQLLLSRYSQNLQKYQDAKVQALKFHRDKAKKRFNKVFVQFHSSFMMHFMNQILLGSDIDQLNNKILGITPRDIIWSNLLLKNKFWIFIRISFANILSLLITIGWVIPVAFVGLISQVPYLAQLVPFLGWMESMPMAINDIISSVLPVVSLMFLTEIVPDVFRFFSFLKCKKTGSQVETDVQCWLFVFLFIHVFLVVTISSGISVVIERLINNPVSIPNLLANNLPKCSNFFCSFLIIRGLSYFGNNLLPIRELIKSIIYYPFVDNTPRKKLHRLSHTPTYKWGSIYPSITVLGCIGIIYSVISPLILLFACICFFMILISYKYTLKYQTRFCNAFETHGSFYPRALFQLYSGIYCMEICLIGLFCLLQKYNLGFIMGITFMITTIGHYQVVQLFGNSFQHLPLSLFNPGANTHPAQPNDFFFHESLQNRNSVLWIPRDRIGISSEEVRHLTKCGYSVTDQGCEIDVTGEMCVTPHRPSF